MFKVFKHLFLKSTVAMIFLCKNENFLEKPIPSEPPMTYRHIEDDAQDSGKCLHNFFTKCSKQISYLYIHVHSLSTNMWNLICTKIST